MPFALELRACGRDVVHVKRQVGVLLRSELHPEPSRLPDPETGLANPELRATVLVAPKAEGLAVELHRALRVLRGNANEVEFRDHAPIVPGGRDAAVTTLRVPRAPGRGRQSPGAVLLLVVRELLGHVVGEVGRRLRTGRPEAIRRPLPRRPEHAVRRLRSLEVLGDGLDELHVGRGAGRAAPLRARARLLLLASFATYRRRPLRHTSQYAEHAATVSTDQTRRPPAGNALGQYRPRSIGVAGASSTLRRRPPRPRAARSARPPRRGSRASPSWPASGTGRRASPRRSGVPAGACPASGSRCPRARS